SVVLGRLAAPNGRTRFGGCATPHMGGIRAADDGRDPEGFVGMNRPLNFLHLSTFYPPYSFGGDGMQLYRLSHALGDAGHHVDVIHCVDSYHLLHPSTPPLQFAEHPNVVRHELRSGFGSLSPLLSQQTGYPLLKLRSI